MVSKIKLHEPAGCTQIKASFVLVTPAYLRGAGQRAELRTASFKGVLRFWWRALRWAAVRAASADDSSALTELQRQEAELFGSAASDVVAQSGQGLIRNLSVEAVTHRPVAIRKAGTNVTPMEAYLLGVGLSRQNVTTANALDAGARFEMTLLIDAKSAFTRDFQKGLTDAIMLMGIVGGIGARSRRGLGSLAVQSLSINHQAQEVPDSPEALQDWLQALQISNPGVAGLPPFTALSQATAWEVLSDNVDRLEFLIADTSKAMVRYRSYGRKVGAGRPRENSIPEQVLSPQFSDDHDAIADAMFNHVKPVFAPRRVAFGLPHNYRFSSRDEDRVKKDSNTAQIDASLYDPKAGNQPLLTSQ